MKSVLLSIFLIYAFLVVMVALMAIVHVGVFLMSWKAKLRPSYAPVMRAGLVALALFVLPSPVSFVAMVTAIIWEATAWMRRPNNAQA